MINSEKLNKQVYIHIGPPKTATTSLQLVLENIKLSDTLFIGISQPRNEKNLSGRNHLAKSIYNYLNNKHCTSKKVAIEDELKVIFNDYSSIIYSEEMILHKPNWKEKIKKLYDLFNEYQIYITYCYRPLSQALPSYYAECINYLPKELQNSKLFFKSGWCSAYDPGLVFKELKLAGFRHINIFKFSDLTANTLSLNSIFGTENKSEGWNMLIKISVSNKKSYGEKIVKKSVKKKKYLVKYNYYNNLPWLLRKILKKSRLHRKLIIEKTLKIEIPEYLYEDEKRHDEFVMSYKHNK